MVIKQHVPPQDNKTNGMSSMQYITQCTQSTRFSTLATTWSPVVGVFHKLLGLLDGNSV